jgi:hypothetical protein
VLRITRNGLATQAEHVGAPVAQRKFIRNAGRLVSARMLRRGGQNADVPGTAWRGNWTSLRGRHRGPASRHTDRHHTYASLTRPPGDVCVRSLPDLYTRTPLPAACKIFLKNLFTAKRVSITVLGLQEKQVPRMRTPDIDAGNATPMAASREPRHLGLPPESL